MLAVENNQYHADDHEYGVYANRTQHPETFRSASQRRIPDGIFRHSLHGSTQRREQLATRFHKQLRMVASVAQTKCSQVGTSTSPAH